MLHDVRRQLQKLLQRRVRTCLLAVQPLAERVKILLWRGALVLHRDHALLSAGRHVHAQCKPVILVSGLPAMSHADGEAHEIMLPVVVQHGVIHRVRQAITAHKAAEAGHARGAATALQERG